MPDFWQHVVLPFKRPSWSMWIDQVKRRRKNGNKTERSRKSLIRERYDEVCIYRGSAKNQKGNVCIPHGANCLVIPNGASIIVRSWMSLIGFPEEAGAEQQRMVGSCLPSGWSEKGWWLKPVGERL